ncbi:MAG: tRNA dihydrouridine synthase DusB [Elusimicrobiota bacterium]|jgi:tRNA-dihydrouridine synthase B|nr:tRNA dihydrouridine synthase DusB [Elusimicrobiota bacterium]
MTKVRIGSIELESNIILAPMADITDVPLRQLAKDGGAGLVYTEMSSAKALVYGNEKTKKLTKISHEERPVAIQIFGSDVKTLETAAKVAQDYGADIVDINLGCPAKKIIKSGAGAKLLANTKLVAQILSATVKSVSIPVTIKTRTGLVPGENIAAEIVEIAQDCGVKMVAIHARAASLVHSGEPDLISFKKACEKSKIPIFANGGIIDEKTAKNFMNIANCSGLMIGRGALGNYSIFKRLSSFFKDGQILPPAPNSEKKEWFKRHVLMSVNHYGEKKGLTLVRKIVPYYIKDFPNAAKIRTEFNDISTISEFLNLLTKIQ